MPTVHIYYPFDDINDATLPGGWKKARVGDRCYELDEAAIEGFRRRVTAQAFAFILEATAAVGALAQEAINMREK